MNGYSKLDYEAAEKERREELQRKMELRERWDESERILNILRTQGAQNLSQATDEEIEQWSKTISTL